MSGEEKHPPYLAHHFETPTQQVEANKLGMWLFLLTEILLFGGLFCWYTVARANHPELFFYGHRYLDKTLGGINTLVLISSSLTMALAVRAAQLGRTRQLVGLLGATLLFACCFLGIKYVEYTHKIHEGLLWGTHFQPHEEAHEPPDEENAGEEGVGAGEPEGTPADENGATADEEEAAARGEESTVIPPAARGPEGLGTGAAAPEEHRRPKNLHIFFGIYFVMTGTHGLHVLAGMAVILWLLLRAQKGHFGPRYYMPVDLGGLYWHLVDIIWIFLFPLLYLIH